MNKQYPPNDVQPVTAPNPSVQSHLRGGSERVLHPKPSTDSNGTARTVPTITPYNLPDLLCLKRFHHLHRNGPTWTAGPFSRAREFAKAVHRVLARALDPKFCIPPETRFLATWSRDAILDPDGVGCAYPNRDMAEQDVHRLHRVVRGAIDNADDAGATVSVEHQFSVRIDGEDGTPLFRLRPRADRIVSRPSDDTLTIIDYKVVTEGAVFSTNRDQAALLVAAAEIEMRQSRRLPATSKIAFETWQVDDQDGRVVVERLHVDDLRETYVSLRQRIMRYVEATDYPAEPGSYCSRCPLFANCSEAQDIGTGLSNLDRLFGHSEDEQ